MAQLSKIDIINTALMLIGAEKINAVTDATKAARLANSVFNVAVQRVFDLPIKWKFATARASLSVYGTDPISGYDHQYELPAGFVRMVALIDEAGDDVEYSWTRELYVLFSGDTETELNMLLTNEDNVFIKYIRYREDVSKWPASFVALVYISIANLLSEPLKQKTVQSKWLTEMFRIAYTSAKIANGMDDVVVGSTGRRLDEGNRDVLDVIMTDDPATRYIVRDYQRKET